jgi:hypothetical protein
VSNHRREGSDVGGEGKLCDFCGGDHGDECPEFKDAASVAGDLSELLDVEMSWKCVGGCGLVRSETASNLIHQGWVFSSKNSVIWADCPRCGELASRRLQSDVARWQAKGSPRGDN